MSGPRGADDLLAALAGVPAVGWDTEFHGVDVRAQSCVARSVCHVFSLAIPTADRLPRGHHDSRTYVVDGALLAHPGIRAWFEDPSVTKPCHNQPVDAHTLRNAGVRVAGAVNTLDMARFFYPEWREDGGFSLDECGKRLLGLGKAEDFEELLGYDAVEYVETPRTRKLCWCGDFTCRRRKAPHDVKREVQDVVVTTRTVRKTIPLPDLSPAHRLWPRYLAYAARDAVVALGVWERLSADTRERGYPWTRF